MKFSFFRSAIALSTIAAASLPLAVRASEQSAESPWVSLYNGREASFSDTDRRQLLATLSALGIEHRETAEQKILVSADSQDVVQDLVAKLFSRGAQANPATTPQP